MQNYFTMTIFTPCQLSANHSLTPINTRLIYTKLGRYHDIIEYRDINLDTISISDGFGFNRNIDISRYIDISIKYRDVFASWDILHPIGLE